MQLNPRAARLRHVLIVTLCAAALAACTATASMSSGGAVSGSSDASAGVRPPAPGTGLEPADGCTILNEPPREGAPCPIEGDFCEVGTHADHACNAMGRCRNGAWSVSEPTCPATCPTAYGDRIPGVSCGEPLCTYLEATCGCVGAASSGDGGLPQDDDAGLDAADDAAGPKLGAWQCVRPGNGCPAWRPLPGTRCAKAMSCDYGACLFGAPGLLLDCANGVWLEVEATCP